MKSTHCQRKIGQAEKEKKKNPKTAPGYFLPVLKYTPWEHQGAEEGGGSELQKSPAQDPALPSVSPANAGTSMTLENSRIT